jgi:hypothetical protein
MKESPAMPCTAHQIIGDQLLLEGWHPRQIATANAPGSRWILLDPGRRIQLTMVRDYVGPHAEISAVHLPGSPHTDPLWRITVHEAPVPTLLAAARTAHDAIGPDSPTVARRVMDKAMRACGWRPDKGWFAQAAAASVTWTSRGGGSAVTWAAPGRRSSGGWEIAGPQLRITAHPDTPADVLQALTSC